MVNENFTTVNLTGEETAIEFSRGYPYYWILNRASSDVYASVTSGITPEADGVYTVPAGEQLRIGAGAPASKIYLSGSGKVQVYAAEIASCPFKSVLKGGEINERSEIILCKDDSEDGLYFSELITGVEDICAAAGIGESSVFIDTDTSIPESGLGYAFVKIEKQWGMNSENFNYTDARIARLTGEIDFTPYSKIIIVFAVGNNGGYIHTAGYFKISDIDKINLPISKTAYNWDGWTFIIDKKIGNGMTPVCVKTFDITKIIGNHELFFGVYHGTEDVGYNARLYLYDIILVR